MFFLYGKYEKEIEVTESLVFQLNTHHVEGKYLYTRRTGECFPPFVDDILSKIKRSQLTINFKKIERFEKLEFLLLLIPKLLFSKENAPNS